MPEVVSSTMASSTMVDLEVQREIEQFLFEEADLLDSWKFRDWVSLLAEDIHYWAPVRENRLYRERSKEIAQPGESAYFDETYAHIVQRVDRLYTHMAWAEDPPSRTRHLVSNIRVRETDLPTEFAVESTLYVHRTRSELDHDWIIGKRYDVLRRVEDGSLNIAKRTILFDVATLIIKNLSLFY